MGRTVIGSIFLFLLGGAWVCAQQPALPSGPSNRFMPGYPGAPVREYFQPVRILAPEGTNVAPAFGGKFVQRQAVPYAVGLQPGNDYRMRITNIPLYPGKEVFPTIKVIGRTYPPQGLELEYPIPVEITQEDIELALNGKFVTRVVYLEDPQTALPLRGDLGSQLSTDAAQGADPIDVAATLGRPVAIVRLGGRIPDPVTGSVDPSFFFGSPPWLAFDKTPSGRYEITRYQNMPYRVAPPVARDAAPQPNTALPPSTPRTADVPKEYHGGGWQILDEDTPGWSPRFEQPLRYTY